MSYLFIIVLIVLVIVVVIFTIWMIRNKRTTIEEISEGGDDASLTYDAINERLKVDTKRRRLKKAGRITLDVILGIVLAFFVLSVINRVFSTGVFPYTTMVVATGSMSEKNEENSYLFEYELDDQIQENDLIVVRSIDSLDEIDLYDIVCYKNEDDEQIIHRVIEIHEDYLITRGDANSVSDSIHVTLDDIVGVYIHFRIPYIGIVVIFVQSNYGIACFVALFLILAVYDHSSSKIKDAEEKRKELLLSLVGERLTFTLLAEDGTIEAINGSYVLTKEDRSEKATYLLDSNDERHDLVVESD